jgi:hypothetical protein
MGAANIKTFDRSDERATALLSACAVRPSVSVPVRLSAPAGARAG